MTVAPQRAQFAVRKQGTMFNGRWSTRTLTVDTATATATISRHNHPNNVLYHSIRVRYVQMWPRFDADAIDDDYNSLKAMMTMRIFGTEVPVPLFSFNDAAVANASLSPTSSAAARTTSSETASTLSADYAFIAGDPKKKSRPLLTSMEDNLYEVWVIRFTTIESYEAAVQLLGSLRNYDGTLLKTFGMHMAEDLAAVKCAWAAHFGYPNDTAACTVSPPPPQQQQQQPPTGQTRATTAGRS